MGKDRRRAVKASHSQSSTTHHILTPARVGPYGYMRAIYIPPYGTRGTTLTPWISKNHLFTGSQGHRVTGLPSCHLPPKPPSHRPTRPQAHRLTGATDTSHRATTTRSNGLPPSPPTITIGCLDHQNHESQGHGLATWHLTILPTHQITRSQACHFTTCSLALHLSHNLTDTRFTRATDHRLTRHQAHRLTTCTLVLWHST